MIFDRLAASNRYDCLSDRFQKAFAFLRSTNLEDMPLGRMDIDGDDIYILVQEPELKPPEEAIWESHRVYADIQLVVSGEERIAFCPTEDLTRTGVYDTLADIEFYQTDGDAPLFPFRKGEFAVFFPQDAHRPCIAPENAEPGVRSRRVVVKVRL